MENKITKISKLVPVDSTLPDGNYSGRWGGYVITLTHNGEEYQLKTSNGIRGMNYPVTVHVENGEATFVD